MLGQALATESTPSKQQPPPLPPPPPLLHPQRGTGLAASKHNPTMRPSAAPAPAPAGLPKPPPPPPKGPPRSFALVTASPAPESWKVAQRKPNTKAKKKSSPAVAAMDDHTFELPHDTRFKLNPNDTENITFWINRALYSMGISNTSVERIQCTETHRILSVTSPTSTLKDLLQHRDLVLKTAWSVHISIVDITFQQKWMWTRIHNISLTQYMGKERDRGL